MSAIQNYLREIQMARYGKDVRQSIVDAIREIDNVAEESRESAKASAAQAQNSAILANNSEYNANEHANRASESAERAALYAQEMQSKIVNNLAETTPGNILDATQGKVLNDKIETNAQIVLETKVKVDAIIEKADLRIKVDASGEEIHLTDSADAKVVEIALYGKAKQNTTSGKNLLENTLTSKTVSDVTITVNEDKSITVNGTASATVILNIGVLQFEKDKEYLLNGIPIIDGNNSNTNYCRMDVRYTTDGTMIKEPHVNAPKWDFGQGSSYKINDSFEGLVCIRINSGYTANNLVFKPMVRLASITDDTYEPYTNGASPNPNYPQEIEVSGSSGSVVVKSCGKNLLPYPYYSGENQTDAGVVFTSDDGSIKAVGASTTNQSTYTLARDLILPKGTFLKTKATVGILVISRYTRSTLSFDAVIANNDITLFDTSDWDYEKYQYRLLFQIKKEDGEVDTILYPMISKEGGEYEPYKETLFTIPTENGLAGIPVSSSGNHTDSNGQQWLCDEIVKYADGTGEYIQRIKSFTLDGSESWNKVSGTNNVFSTSTKAIDGLLTNDIAIISNRYVGDTSEVKYLDDKRIKYGTTSNRPTPVLSIKDSSFVSTSTAVLKEFLAENNVIGYYPLANEIRTPLTAEELAEIEKLSTFYPVTNISNDGGCGMSVKYHADSKNYIDRMVAEQVASIVASMK